MRILNVRRGAVLPGIALLILSAVSVKADITAYAGLGGGAFGTIDLNTGVFTSLGNLGLTPAGLGVADGELFAASYDGTGTLYQVNPANGTLSAPIGSSGILYYGGFGSTTSGLYALALNGFGELELYSINPLTGAATDIGGTGISPGSWRDLSVNSGTLYYGNGAGLYTLNTSTGAGTPVGPFGGSASIGALLTVGGTLYGGDEGNDTIDTINTTTGTATILSTNNVSNIWGLAPDPLPTPEPGSVLLLITIVAALIVTKRLRFS